MSLALLLSVVADKTGYPVDMLNGGMDLETDLGIDSIKKVEIFAAVRQRAEGLPSTASPQMAQLFEAGGMGVVVHVRKLKANEDRARCGRFGIHDRCSHRFMRERQWLDHAGRSAAK